MWKNTDGIILAIQEYKRGRGNEIKILDFTRIGHSIINQRMKQNQTLNMLKRKKEKTLGKCTEKVVLYS